MHIFTSVVPLVFFETRWRAVRWATVNGHVVGCYVARTVCDETGTRALIRKGALLTPSLIRTLQRHEIHQLWVQNEFVSDLAVGGTVRQETRLQATRAVESLAEASLTGSGKQDAAQSVLLSASQIVGEILEINDVIYNLNHLRVWDSYTYAHCVQVAELSVVIGKELGFDHDHLNRLAIGAVLHDVGKVKVPREILDKPGPLTPEEYAIMRRHARDGWDMVHDVLDTWHTATVSILQHHERMDGSGYPDGLQGDGIYIFSRIVAVADVFDATRAERSYRSSLSGQTVYDILQHEAGTRLDKQVVEALMRRVAFYPTGEIVRLGDGSTGIVTHQNPDAPLLPTVVRVADEHYHPTDREEIDLSRTEFGIAAIMSDWPDEVRAIIQTARGD